MNPVPAKVPFRPRPTAGSLARVGVEISDRYGHSWWLACKACRAEWSPNIPGRYKRLARGWWKCPNGCNA